MIKALIALTIALLATTASAADKKSVATDKVDPVKDFFQILNKEQDTFGEYRFLTSPAVQNNPSTRNFAGQMLATQLSFLGRPNDALRAFPMRGNDQLRPDAELPATTAFSATPAVDWITDQASKYRVVMVNEAHHAPQTRLLTFSLLRALREKGYGYLAVEALTNDGNDPVSKGYATRKTGIYTREPVFAELLREAKRLGYTLLPYEPNDKGEQSQQQRETGMAQAIADCLASNPDARILIHAGYAHIGERQYGLPDDAKPMAMELARLSGLPILTVDQTSTRSYELEDADTIGRKLSVRFDVAQPSVLIERENGNPWSNKPGDYDVSVLLPAQSAASIRPGWLTLGGRHQATTVDMSACIDHLPCLAEARYAAEGDDAIPADQFVVLANDEMSTPLYLAPGRYRLRLIGKEGTPLTERELSVPAAQAGTPQTTATP